MSYHHEIIPTPQPSVDTKESVTEEARSWQAIFSALTAQFQSNQVQKCSGANQFAWRLKSTARQQSVPPTRAYSCLKQEF